VLQLQAAGSLTHDVFLGGLKGFAGQDDGSHFCDLQVVDELESINWNEEATLNPHD
jgi:hypothetical protein